MYCSLDASPLQRGFQVSPSQISLQWDSFRPFLASPGGNFSLGFKEVRSNGYILSIMYTIRSSNESSQQLETPFSMEMVWSANGDSPSSRDAIFAINQQGSLLLSDGLVGTLWSTGTNTGQTLQLQDSGNLFLSSISSGGATVAAAWQSFDHPTDTLLQGQNFTASMRLIASISATSPSIKGFFYFKMEVDGIALYADLGQNASQLMYWKLPADQETAVINAEGGPIYARMESAGYLGMYQAENARVSYEVFQTYNSAVVSKRRLKLESDGNLRVYYWDYPSWKVDFEAIKDFCSLPSPCGPYGICNMSNTCVCPPSGKLISSNLSANYDNVSFQAANTSDYRQGCAVVDPVLVADDCSESVFMKMQGVDSVFHEQAKVQVEAGSIQECQALCRKDCDCAAFFYSNGSARKCFLAYQPVLSLLQTSSLDDLAFIKVSSSSSAAPFNSRTAPARPYRPRSAAVQIVVAISSFLFAASLCSLAAWHYKRTRRSSKEDADYERKAFLDELPGLPPFLRFKEVEAASSNFRTRTRPAGTLGPLYQGILAGGVSVVMTRLTLINQDLKSVRIAVAAIGRIAHPNLARLCGYSIEGPNLVLVYEFPPNGWLDLAMLDWQQRVEVATGVARALAALHEATMVHGLLDLEAIFVAEGGVAKVGGVGVWDMAASELAAPPASLAVTAEGVVQAAQPAAEKGDVYRFGLVLTELMIGRRLTAPEGGADWRRLWREALAEGREHQLLDKRVAATATGGGGGAVSRLSTVATLCLHPSPLERPAMSTVVRLLDGTFSLPNF